MDNDMENIHEGDSEDKKRIHKRKWRSIRLCYAIMFFSSIGYSIQMTSLWPYMRQLSEDYTKDFMGWVVSIYSFGQLFACPICAYIAGKTYQFKVIFIFAMVMNIAGNYLYSVVEDIESMKNKSIALLISRTIMGLSGGSIAAARLFLTLATTEEERLGPMSTLSAFQALGFVIGPGLQAIFVPIGYPGFVNTLLIHINIYTASAFFNLITSLLILILLVFLFSDKFLVRLETDQSNDPGGDLSHNFENQYDLAGCMLVAFFVCMMSLSVMETGITPMTMDNFAWSKSKATLINSIALATSGVLSLGVFVSLKYVTRIIKEYILLEISFILILLSGLVFIPFGNQKMSVSLMELKPIGRNHSEILPPNPGNTTGCDLLDQPWCSYVPPLQIWQYFTALTIFTFGYPAANILSYVIFSRLLEPRLQGVGMGLLTGFGSGARIIGPLYFSHCYHNFGTQITFGSWCGFLVLVLCLSPYFLVKMYRYQNHLKQLQGNIN